ncbi:hypothetical protein DOTSEDRAFT_51305 [Dothistroma septosporum NZE10]|uniref:Uncharacterized protein n=1 Tax=Dothistroma septosporum (strain NZE10 / CBS 128990) TaxID=675120 RepID=N1PWZ5_DOTSN|nr:hypothetical protein DOTSEDRAFT_51305 [Dothistroma septosporum NZE10]
MEVPRTRTRSDLRYPNTGKPWSRADDDVLRRHRRPTVETPYKELEPIFGRTALALRLRMNKLTQDSVRQRKRRGQRQTPIKQESDSSREPSLQPVRSGFKIRLDFGAIGRQRPQEFQSPTLRLNFATVHPDYCKYPQLRRYTVPRLKLNFATVHPDYCKYPQLERYTTPRPKLNFASVRDDNRRSSESKAASAPTESDMSMDPAEALLRSFEAEIAFDA